MSAKGRRRGRSPCQRDLGSDRGGLVRPRGRIQRVVLGRSGAKVGGQLNKLGTGHRSALVIDASSL